MVLEADGNEYNSNVDMKEGQRNESAKGKPQLVDIIDLKELLVHKDKLLEELKKDVLN